MLLARRRLWAHRPRNVGPAGRADEARLGHPATAFRSSSSGGRAPTPRRRSTASSRGISPRRPTRLRTGSRCARPGCWRTGRSGYATIRTSSRAAQIEDAALTWGGFAPAGLLTLLRPGERLALLERMVDDASRVVRIVFALNRVWPPTLKRLADRVAALQHRPPRLAERIEQALTEPDPHRALVLLTRLQADTVALAPDGPNIVRARTWLGDGLAILGRPPRLRRLIRSRGDRPAGARRGARGSRR